MGDSPKEPLDGYLAEYHFINEGMRQDQRERHGFLGFTLAASGLVLGLIIGSDPALKPPHVCVPIGLVALVTFVAERLTLRASQGVATAGVYLRLFVEPHIESLRYQGRNVVFLENLKDGAWSSRWLGLLYQKGNVSSSRGLGLLTSG